MRMMGGTLKRVNILCVCTLPQTVVIVRGKQKIAPSAKFCKRGEEQWSRVLACGCATVVCKHTSWSSCCRMLPLTVYLCLSSSLEFVLLPSLYISLPLYPISFFLQPQDTWAPALAPHAHLEISSMQARFSALLPAARRQVLLLVVIRCPRSPHPLQAQRATATHRLSLPAVSGP